MKKFTVTVIMSCEYECSADSEEDAQQMAEELVQQHAPTWSADFSPLLIVESEARENED